MPNKFQVTISEIMRVRKRIRTAQKTLDKNDAVLRKSANLLVFGPSYRRSPIPEHKLNEISLTLEEIKNARKTLHKSDTVLNLSAKLLHQTGIRPYKKVKHRKRKESSKELPKKEIA